MDLVTAAAVLGQQVAELQNISAQLGQQSDRINYILNEENAVTEINPQVHAITANMNISVQAINSTVVIVQQAIDRVAELSNA